MAASATSAHRKQSMRPRRRRARRQRHRLASKQRHRRNRHLAGAVAEKWRALLRRQIAGRQPRNKAASAAKSKPEKSSRQASEIIEAAGDAAKSTAAAALLRPPRRHGIGEIIGGESGEIEGSSPGIGATSRGVRHHIFQPDCEASSSPRRGSVIRRAWLASI